MTQAAFAFTPGAGETEFRLLDEHGIQQPVDIWAIEAPPALLPGVDLLKRFEAAEAAIAASNSMLVDNGAVAGLSAREAVALNLPALAPAVAYVATRGILTRPDFGADLEWRRSTGQPILGAVRMGAFLRIGSDFYRLPDVLFAIAEAVDALNAAGDEEASRYKALGALREALPPAETTGKATAGGFAKSMTIAVADAFSLDLEGDGASAQLVPVLHRGGGPPDEHLLPDAFQDAFAKQFNAFGAAKHVYALGGGSYVVLAGPVRRALEVVRRTQAKPLAAKRVLLANPRAVLREALGDDVDETVLESVFRETAAYSERVVGLGLWSKRVLPWIQISGLDWFDEGAGIVGAPKPEKRDGSPGGIVIGDRRVPLSADSAVDLRDRVERAIAAGDRRVFVTVDGEEVLVPATPETLSALKALENARDPDEAKNAGKDRKQEAKPLVEVLVIRSNEEEIEVEGVFVPRPVPRAKHPVCLAATLKPHQDEGLTWLCDAYRAGRPGVLLADDMGLGKTLQGLAFLAWLREGMDAGHVLRAPVAVVAPTGLLQNWKAEEARHLTRPGLGRCLEAFDKGLVALKRTRADDRPALDVAAIAKADWLLTTYETLRDYDRDFGAVRFAAMLFDEAQKIKTPGTRLTDAAKAMQVDFRIALTGTPVENRLSDLWCIADAVHPAFLGDLKTFSAEFERSPDPDRLRRLKASLDKPQGGAPPFLLRRLKSERLHDLPMLEEIAAEEPMPAPQREAYEAVLTEARAGCGEPGAALSALQRLKAISLHPDSAMDGSDEAFIATSARCRLAFAALDRIAQADERALVFVQDLALQARLAGVIQRRYRLSAPPAIINGSVSGRARQARVDRFQGTAEEGYDVMILSPRAGGVGLTLTAANHVIHLERWWNPAVEDQCTARVVRIGQTKPVVVHVPLAILDPDRPSFDRNLDALIRRKRRLFQDAFMPPEPTAKERDELFRETVK